MLDLNSETLIWSKARFTLGVRAEKTRQHAKYTPPPPAPRPIELCPAPFLGLTVQPCGEPCDSVQCWSGIRF
jgi:hypothetical protein